MAQPPIALLVRLLVIVSLSVLIAVLASIAFEPAFASRPTSPPESFAAAQPAASPFAPPYTLTPRNRIDLLIFCAIATLVVLPIAAFFSLRTAAWYWGLMGGWSASGLVLLALPTLAQDEAQWTVLLMVWVGPLALLRALRKPPPLPQLAGERMATRDDLHVHHLETWPEPAPQIRAGACWHAARKWWRQWAFTMHPTVYGLDADQEGRHSLLVVPTGLGKGLWTVTQLLTWNGSAIVNDLKGDTYPLTAGWRAVLGPVWVLDAARPMHRFDPTAQAETEDDLRPLAHAVCDDPADRSYWSQHAERILLVLMLAAKQARQPVFPFVARALHGRAATALAMVAEVDPALADRIRPESDRTFGSAWETLTTRCASLLSPNVLATLGGSDFTAADLLDARATLYLQIPEARLADLRPFLRLLWTSLMQQLATHSDQVGGDHSPLLLVLDEAGRTPFADLPDYLVTLRSRRISCAVLVQALSQLRAAYGQQADTILANCSIQIYARTEDLATMEYVSQRIGYTEEILPTVSQTQSLHGGSITHGQHRRFRPLVSPQQLRTLQDHQIAAFLPACPPAALARMDWRQHLALRQRSGLRAPEFTALALTAPVPAAPAAIGYVEPD